MGKDESLCCHQLLSNLAVGCFRVRSRGVESISSAVGFLSLWLFAFGFWLVSPSYVFASSFRSHARNLKQKRQFPQAHFGYCRRERGHRPGTPVVLRLSIPGAKTESSRYPSTDASGYFPVFWEVGAPFVQENQEQSRSGAPFWPQKNGWFPKVKRVGNQPLELWGPGCRGVFFPVRRQRPERPLLHRGGHEPERGEDLRAPHTGGGPARRWIRTAGASLLFPASPDLFPSLPSAFAPLCAPFRTFGWVGGWVGGCSFSLPPGGFFEVKNKLCPEWNEAPRYLERASSLD